MGFSNHDGTALTDLLSLEGRRALVTGGSRGIGLAIATRLAEAGAYVAIADISGAQAAAKELSATTGREVLAAEFDVADHEGATAAIGTAAEQLGGLDILVNNAGVYPPAHVLEQPFEQWRSVLAVNLDGTLTCSTAAARLMAAAGTPGRIVNITSTQGLRGAAPAMSAYTSSKHAIIGLTKALAIDLAPSGIRVLAVAPNVVITPGYQETLDSLLSAGMPEQVVEQIKAGTPMGRPVTADEVARAVLFCVSDLSSAMTGSTVLVDTGAMAL